MINSMFQFVNTLTDFYNMDWYGFLIGRYMVWVSLGGISWISFEAYLKSHKNKNDIRRFLVDEQHRK